MMTENIDKSQWVPKGETVLNAWRLKHGDVCHNEGRYYVMFPLPMDELRGRNILDDNQLWAALQIYALHRAAFSQVGFAKMRMESMPGGSWLREMKIDPFHAYQAIMNPLPKWQQHMIGRVTWEEVRANDYAWIANQTHRIQESFDSLLKSLDEFRERMQTDNNFDGTSAPGI